MIKSVLEFHQKFDLPDGTVDKLSNDKHAQAFRLGFLQEELDELHEALEQGDRVKAFDALLDLAYVTYGTALFMGVDPWQWHEGMAAVQKANMSKERAVSKDQSKRGSTFDVIKPEGWTGPEQRLKEVLSWDVNAPSQGDLDL
jgi:predicted HAD superfamily Cof-like phosphohydrolase